jgi:GLPGLI family protein
MKKFITIIIVSFFTTLGFAQDQRVVSECTLEYALSVVDPNADPLVVKSMAETSKILYVKGTKARTDLISPSFIQTSIYNSKSDSTVILREIGKVKYITYLDAKKRNEKNQKYEGIKFNITSETKTILGYDCKKAIAILQDGTSYNVFYAPAIIPSTREVEYQFKDLPGFALEYETQSEDGKTRVTYSATKISLLPVPIAKFDIPQSGYRVL